VDKRPSLAVGSRHVKSVVARVPTCADDAWTNEDANDVTKFENDPLTLRYLDETICFMAICRSRQKKTKSRINPYGARYFHARATRNKMLFYSTNVNDCNLYSLLIYYTTYTLVTFARRKLCCYLVLCDILLFISYYIRKFACCSQFDN